MSVRRIEAAEPFFSLVYLEEEEEFRVEPQSIVINLQPKGGSDVLVNGTRIPPLHSAVAERVTLTAVKKVLVVEDYLRYDIQVEENRMKLTQSWKSLYQWSGREAQKGIPYHKTEKIQLAEDTFVTVCYAAADAPSGPHKEHARPIDEVHAQIQGIGKVQLFRDNDTNTQYQEYILAPGNTHELIFDQNGEYPWHQYRSVTPCIYIPVEMIR